MIDLIWRAMDVLAWALQFVGLGGILIALGYGLITHMT